MLPHYSRKITCMKLSKATVLRILYFLVFCCTGAWLPKLADFCASKNLSNSQTSLLLSITPVMMFAVQPLYGMMADKLGYKKTMLVASLLSAVSYLGYLYNGGFWWFVTVTIIMSIFYNTIQPVLDSIALQIAKHDKKFSYGTLRIFGAAGWAFTSIITGQVIDAINITVIFVVSFITMLLVFIFSFWLKEEAADGNIVERSSFKNVSDVIKSKRMLFLLLCVFIISAGATSIWNFYSTYMKENGASDSLVGYGLSFQGLCELPLFYFSARIILRLGLKNTLLLTTGATVIRLFLYSAVKNPVAALPIEMLHGFSWSLFWVVCVEYVNKLVDERWLATGQSLLYASYFGIGAIAGNYWTEYLLSWGMKISGVFLINAGVVLLVVLLLFIFMKNEKDVELVKQ